MQNYYYYYYYYNMVSYLREECRLRVFENRTLRRIFGPKRGENEEWKKLYSEEFHSFYRSSNILR